jgi:hypothetical protein
MKISKNESGTANINSTPKQGKLFNQETGGNKMSLETEQFNHPLIGNVRIADDQTNSFMGEVWVITENGERVRTLQRELTQTIDITPAGCTTPEGNARVQAAQQEWDSATMVVANAAEQLVGNYREGLLFHYREDVRGLKAAIAVRERAKEAFLRAVAGAPEQTK